MQIRQGIRGWWIALAAALADRLTKVLVARFCPRGGAVIPGVLNLRPVENRFTTSMKGLVIWLVRHPDAPTLVRTGLWLIAGGGLGNLYDRLTTGSVSDFIELAFVRFAVFNVADVCICVGAGLVLLSALREEKNGK